MIFKLHFLNEIFKIVMELTHLGCKLKKSGGITPDFFINFKPNTFYYEASLILNDAFLAKC